MQQITPIKLIRCSRCHLQKTVNNFYKRKNGRYDCYCKPCRASITKELKDKNKINKITNLIDYFSRYPQFDYNQEHSLAIFAIIDRRLWAIGLDYINTKYNTNYNYKDTFIHLTRIGKHIARFFTYKECPNCKKIKQTYVNSEDQDYVFSVLENVNLPIIQKDFNLTRGTTDGWSELCSGCSDAMHGAVVQKKKVRIAKKERKKLIDRLFPRE